MHWSEQIFFLNLFHNMTFKTNKSANNTKKLGNTDIKSRYNIVWYYLKILSCINLWDEFHEKKETLGKEKKIISHLEIFISLYVLFFPYLSIAFYLYFLCVTIKDSTRYEPVDWKFKLCIASFGVTKFKVIKKYYCLLTNLNFWYVST